MRGSQLGWRAPAFFMLALFAVANAPSAVTPSVAAAPPPLLTGVHRIVAIGASITQFAARPGGYVWRMQHTLDILYPDAKIQVIDAGVSGNTSFDMVHRFAKDVLERHPDLVTIKEGFNDLTRKFANHPLGDGPGGASPEEYAENMGKMAEMAREAGIRVLIMTPTIYEDNAGSIRNRKLKEYADSIRDLARRERLPLADQNEALLQAWQNPPAGKPVKLTTDGVHLTLAGDAVVARTTLLALGVPATDLDAAETTVRSKIPLP